MAEKKQTQGNLFFGWENIKWFIREIGEMYSSRKSYFSKKRIESGIAFIIAQWGMVFFLLEKHADLNSSDLALWAGIEFAISGYIISQIQKEKKGSSDESENV
ncbi:hypothetical protein UFOVP972_61 [uncultured Caudovirales phage]|jgi:hypothetical protein|uniref:Uncharacterized protein n=1 Tax=uncultured Caudovirales phage TaxID=2100421 RepID=A0A6J5PTW1_9CAUD|nr:hypothetical protein UFOVP972_61 [uncultured Caudovirales phage]